MKPIDYVSDRIVKPADTVTLLQAAALCRKPYYGHPRGCPNYGKAKRCPPRTKRLGDGKVLLVGFKFELEAWARRMKERHEGWTDRQCRNLLYWQRAVRQELLTYARRQRTGNWKGPIYMTPEAHCINITEMMKRAGRPLQWPPRSHCWLVALIGQTNGVER